MEKADDKWVEGATVHLCGLGHVEGHLTAEAKAEIHAFAHHLRDHRGRKAVDCRFCATRPAPGRQVVVYVGSMRFRQLMKEHALAAMAADDNLCILLPEWWDVIREPGFVDMPGVAHRRKIELADRVLAFNYGGYIGDDTRAEIGSARLSGIPVDYLEPLA